MTTMINDIKVNGVTISAETISAEIQYHPAEDFAMAQHNAKRALVIKEILLQKAAEMQLCKRNAAVKDPDSVIDALLKQALHVPEADQESCQRYYENNQAKFFTSPLFEVSHILYIAPPHAQKPRAKVLQRATRALQKIQTNPNIFSTLAQAESACSSAQDGGRLGQISRGQTTPRFETALFQMQTGDISPAPVASEVGYHIIKVHQRIDGKKIPFDTIKNWIAQDLHNKSWKRAFQQYMQLLVGQSQISGFQFNGAQSPLVQ